MSVPFKLGDLIPGVLYKLSSPITFYKDGQSSEFTKDEVFMYDGQHLVAMDGARIDPKVMQKAKINLIPPSQWNKNKEVKNG